MVRILSVCESCHGGISEVLEENRRLWSENSKLLEFLEARVEPKPPVMPLYPFGSPEEFEQWQLELDGESERRERLRMELMRGNNFVGGTKHVIHIWKSVLTTEAADFYCLKGNRKDRKSIEEYRFFQIFEDCFLRKCQGNGKLIFKKGTRRFFNYARDNMVWRYNKVHRNDRALLADLTAKRKIVSTYATPLRRHPLSPPTTPASTVASPVASPVASSVATPPASSLLTTASSPLASTPASSSATAPASSLLTTASSPLASTPASSSATAPASSVATPPPSALTSPVATPRKRVSSGKPVVSQRTYRKREPKRIAKISRSEVKERLKMLKRDSWQCPHCIQIYYIRKPFENHLREEHKVSEDEIKEIFQEDEEIGVLDEEIFKCQICSKIYLVEQRLLAHEKLHGPDGSLTHKCPCYCSIYFATKEEAQDHARQNHKNRLYCDICDKYMTGHDSLRKHKSNHSDKNPSQRNIKKNFVCDKCGKKYSSRTLLTDHMRSDCGRIRLYPCEICGKRLTTAWILKTHLLLHKDDTPFQCDKCGKTFKVKYQYKSHIKNRHNKPFKCHLCPKEYPRRESLYAHMTAHTGIKRFLCNGCGKRFTYISNLQAHRKVHADTCGALPLNAKATQYMGVQKGNLLMAAKAEAGLDYKETNTLIAKEVIDRDLPMAQELNYSSEPSAPMVTQPLNYAAQEASVAFIVPTANYAHLMNDE